MLASALMAQPSPAPEPAADRGRIEEALKELDLKPRQRLSIGKILRDAKASGQDRQLTRQQIREVLTAEQQEQLARKLQEGGQTR